MMTFSTIVIFLIFSIDLVSSHGDHSGEGHDHDCACRAVELGYKIDCDDTTTMLNALQTLRNNSCLTGNKCKSDVMCDKSFAIVLSHHDHCLSPPAEIANKTEVHAYEDICTTCKISKAFNPALPLCASVKCDANASFVAAFANLQNVTNGCSDNCNTTTCIDSFRLLRAAYHRCDGGEFELPDAVEKGVHAYDGACEAVDCNPKSKEESNPICLETVAPSTTTTSSSSSSTSEGSISTISISTIVIAAGSAIFVFLQQC
jgi:hypothetical protein